MDTNKKEMVFPASKSILDVKQNYDYSIYAKVDEKRFKLLISKGCDYDKSSCSFYNRKELEKVFINIKDKMKYQYDIQEYVSNIIEDNNICLNVKANLLNDIAKDTITNLLEKEVTFESLGKVDNFLTTKIDFILKDELAMQAMLKVTSYDYYTSTHCIDVSTYAIAFGKYLNLDKEDLKLLGKAALLHDIGKKNVPREIICKNGKLTYEEFEEVKKHPAYSAKILKENGETNTRLLNIVEQHHEKCDGTGYPKGLKEDQIDDFAKIVSICDIFNALTTRRTYKKEMAKYEAIMIMYEDMNSFICTDYLEKFVKFLKFS